MRSKLLGTPKPTHEASSALVSPVSHEQVLQQFRIVFNAVKTHFQQVERKAGLGGAQVWALAIIRERPGIGVGELANALNVRQPTASIIVRNLTQQGLVEAGRDGLDRRSVQLRITTEGRKVLRRAPARFRASYRRRCKRSIPPHWSC